MIYIGKTLRFKGRRNEVKVSLSNIIWLHLSVDEENNIKSGINRKGEMILAISEKGGRVHYNDQITLIQYLELLDKLNLVNSILK